MVLIVHYFNPRSHERSDSRRGRHDSGKDISIHAPTRGATMEASRNTGICGNFNPRSHERSDRKEAY